jgi:NAD(P)H-hydrate epimerase
MIAAPSGEARVSPVATAALATAGTGDVLAGAIVGLLAQGLDPFDAASLGVWLHGRAGEMLADEVGDAGVLAGDLLPRLPFAVKELRQA